MLKVWQARFLPGYCARRLRPTVLRGLLLIMLATAAITVPGRAQIVSMFPRANEVSPRGTLVDLDYPHLFEPGSPWQQALSRIHTFGLGEHFAATAAPAQLWSLFAFLRSHGVGLSVAWAATPARGCGHRVEGMSFQTNHSFNLATRLRRLGAPLVSIRMDEPLHFGHYYHGHDACSYSIGQLATGTAKIILQARQVFPGIQVFDVEPLTGLGSPAELSEWIAALRRDTSGAAPTAMIFDVQWYRPWWTYVRPMIGVLRRAGLSYGVIFNATGQQRSDQAWAAAARQHVLQWNSVAPEPPAYVVFQSWNDHPTHVLPESDPTTLPYLVNWYCTLPSSRCVAASR